MYWVSSSVLDQDLLGYITSGLHRSRPWSLVICYRFGSRSFLSQHYYVSCPFHNGAFLPIFDTWIITQHGQKYKNTLLWQDDANRRNLVPLMSLCIPGMQTAGPLDRKQMFDPLDQWDCVLEWNCRASTRLPQQHNWGSNWSLCCEEDEDLQGVEWNRGRHVMCDQLFTLSLWSPVNCRRKAQWIVVTKPSELSSWEAQWSTTEGQQSHWLFSLLAQSLVKHPLKGSEARVSESSWGRQRSEAAPTGETWFHCEFVHPRDANCWPPRWEPNCWHTGPVRLCIGVKLQGLHTCPISLRLPL